MVRRSKPDEYDIVLKFGGGLHTRAPEDEIDDREASDGKNFLLDAENSDLKPRAPFDLVGTVPNTGSINGAGSFRLSDGTVQAFVQGGTSVYEWDGASFDASPPLDTVNGNAKLRGNWRSHSWDLDGKLLISDLALLEPVKEWDGTTFADISFTGGTGVKCKYITVNDERAIYSHVTESGTTYGHMMVGSTRSDYTTISVSDRPSSALSDEDPFFLLTPDLRAINSSVEALGTHIISTDHGRIFHLLGSSAQDFEFKEFYPGSFASGDESMAYIGNDILYGRQGRIESVRDTDRFGDTAADDITRQVLDQVTAFTSWRTVYNSRLNRAYMFPAGGSEVWVYDIATRDLGGKLSPWMRWKTKHSLAFQPTMVMSMLDPVDGLEYVFMGDSSGNFYRLEGTGTSGDGGTTAIQMQFLSKLFSLDLEAKFYTVEGYIKYRKSSNSVDVSVQLEASGENVWNSERVVTLPATTAGAYYNNNQYYKDGEYYGVAFLDRLVRQGIEIPRGDANEFQVRVTVESTKSFEINEIGLRFKGSG